MSRLILIVAIAALGCSGNVVAPAGTGDAGVYPAQPGEESLAPSFEDGADAAPPSGPLSPSEGPESTPSEANPDSPDAPSDDDAPEPISEPGAAPISEPGRLPLHHLTAAEYNTTVAHLLRTDLRPADYFPASGSSEFDAHTGVLANLSPVLVQGYYDAAKALAADLMENLDARADVLDCDPAAASEQDEAQCVRTFLSGFGHRAFRRPLSEEEVTRYQGSYDRARDELGMDARAAAEHLVRLLLSSPNFFLRVEVALDGVDVEQVEAYALASRLSYLLWSSAPDVELYNRVAAAELRTSEDILRELDRMLDDPRSEALLRDFVGQWLGLRRLSSHAVEGSAFPVWNDEMLLSMTNHANAFIGGFFRGEQRWDEFLSHAAPQEPGLEALFEEDPAQRSGFLTLPAFLTLSSHADRTAPTTRATTVLGGLLCTAITPPPNVAIPDLSATGEGALAESNIRTRLEQHRAADECASCHDILDPIGLSLERYDAIGRYRTHYGDGSEVDASGEYAGTAFADITELAPLLAADSRFARCPVEKLTTYALRRSASAEDDVAIDALASEWGNGSLDDLLRRVVTHPMFAPAL